MKTNKIDFVKTELKQYELSLDNYLVNEMYINLVEASEILSKKQLTNMIEDYVDLYGFQLYK